MANCHSSATVTPNIPMGLMLIEIERELRRAGFEFDPGPNGTLYLYAEEGPQDWVMDDNAQEDVRVEWESALQTLAKAGDLELVVEGGYWGDKCRPGWFGGWVMRITKDSVQQMSTTEALSMMRHNPEFGR